MAKYKLRKIDPESRSQYRYSSCDEFSSFASLRDAINKRDDIWYGGGFDVLDAENKIIFDKQSSYYCLENYGKRFTLSQVTKNYGE